MVSFFSALSSLLNHPKVHLEPVATNEQLQVTEASLGFQLPEILREFYQQISNGGRLINGNLYGIQGGRSYDGHCVHDLYDMFNKAGDEDAQYSSVLYHYQDEFLNQWPEKLLPAGLFGNYGGESTLFLDCSQERVPVFYHDVFAVGWDAGTVVFPIISLYDSFVEFLEALQEDAIAGTRVAYNYISTRYASELEFWENQRIVLGYQPESSNWRKTPLCAPLETTDIPDPFAM